MIDVTFLIKLLLIIIISWVIFLEILKIIINKFILTDTETVIVRLLSYHKNNILPSGIIRCAKAYDTGKKVLLVEPYVFMNLVDRNCMYQKIVAASIEGDARIGFKMRVTGHFIIKMTMEVSTLKLIVK